MTDIIVIYQLIDGIHLPFAGSGKPRHDFIKKLLCSPIRQILNSADCILDAYTDVVYLTL